MGLDLYHVARWSPAAFDDFRAAAEAGVPTVNSYRGARATEDRLVSLRACVDAGLPVADFEYGTADTVTPAPPVLLNPRHETAPDGHASRSSSLTTARSRESVSSSDTSFPAGVTSCSASATTCA